MELDNIDIERLRRDLEDYFKSDIFKNPIGNADVIDLDKVTDLKLLSIALWNDFDLEEYKKDMQR